MKKSILILLLFCINNYAQKNEDSNEIFPVFPICKLLADTKQEQCFSESLQEHIEKYFFYPKTAWDIDLEAIVKVQFDINEKGEINNILPSANIVGVTFVEREAFKAAKQLFQFAAVQMMEKLPLLTPAKVNDIPTKKTFQTSITFKIPTELSFNEVDNAPIINGCEESSGEESKMCFKESIAEHIRKNFKYPRRAIKKEIEGDVFIQFSINRDGFLVDFTTIGPDPILEDEAFRIMSSLQILKPANYNGKNVKITYALPISFRLN